LILVVTVKHLADIVTVKHFADMSVCWTCRNSMCLKSFSLISMCWLWGGHHCCFSQRGHMHV